MTRAPSPALTADIDPITLEVMRNAMFSIADEMTAGLVRASYSTNIKDRRDCSCAIYTLGGEVVAMSEWGGTPLHLGTMHSCLKTALAVFPPATFEPGDAVIFNTPYPAGPGHLNDVCIIGPIFTNAHLFGFAASQAHRVDVGGFAPGSMPFGVTEIYQEGLQITPLKIQRRGTLDEHLLAFINQNLRTPEENRGDLMAQIAANLIAERRIQELAARYGAETLRRYQDAVLDYAERRMVAGLRSIPAGTWSAEDVIEGDGINTDLLTVRVTLSVGDGQITADFSATDPQTPGPLNCRWPSVAACVYYVLKAVLDPEVPPNAGAYRPIRIITRPGSLLEARFPAAVCNANIVTTQRIVDVLLGALLQAVPERVLAACSGTMNLLNIGGFDPRDGSYYNYIETYGGGQGAMHDRDGMDGVQNHMTNTRNAPVEVLEATYPLRVLRYGLVPDSEGAGRQRGGVGMLREFEVLGSYTRLTLSSDRQRVAPWGALGGRSAAGSRCTLTRGDRSFELDSKVTIFLEQGDRLLTVTPGGGGWDEPAERDPAQVQRDVAEGLVSLGRAREVYSVALDPATLTVDHEATRRLRAQGGQHAGTRSISTDGKPRARSAVGRSRPAPGGV